MIHYLPCVETKQKMYLIIIIQNIKDETIRGLQLRLFLNIDNY